MARLGTLVSTNHLLAVRAILFQTPENSSDNVATIEISGSGDQIKFTGNTPTYFDSGIDAGQYPIINVADPNNPQDAATKAYVDLAMSTAIASL